VGQIEHISREWVEQWAEIQQEVEKTCARIANEMGKMRTALDGDALVRLREEMAGDREILERLTRLRQQVTGIFGRISNMGKEAEEFRKDLQRLGPALRDQSSDSGTS
jgi:hypothetical protein